MSFTSDVKNEIIRHAPQQSCCIYSFFAGMAAFTGAFKMSSDDTSYTFSTENSEVADKFSELCGDLFMLYMKFVKKGDTNIIHIENADFMLKELDLMRSGDVSLHVPANLSECCARAFVSGAFLSGGSITSPEKQYHLEFVTPHYTLNAEFQKLFGQFDIPSKWIMRKSKYVTYFKDNEVISDVLAMMNAPHAVWEINNINIKKSINNRTNRIVNCETANIDRVVDAATKQIKAIKLIDSRLGIDNMPPALVQIARLRLEHPELSISDIGEMVNPPLSKSGVNHRIRKILELAENLK